VEWGGFGPSPSQATTGPSTTPTFDNIIKRGSWTVRTSRPIATVEDETPPPPAEEPHKPFNYDFDEPVRSMKIRSPVPSQEGKASSAQPQSLLTMQREGKRLSKKQKTLLQAAAMSRTPLPNLEENISAGGKEEREVKGDAKVASEPGMETDEKKQFQNKVWNLVRGKWL